MTPLHSLASDTIFGFRQLRKNKAATAAAILSLALGIGGSLAAFRLIDALFLRPLPIAHPERLYDVNFQNWFEGKVDVIDSFTYPAVQVMRDSLKSQADLMAISRPWRTDITFASDQEIERAFWQYVSGTTFAELGIKSALGRLLTPNDDSAPGAHPYVVISYDYWSRRFSKDPGVIGRSFHTGTGDVFQIIGVTEPGFTGMDPGVFTDMFVPNAMNSFVTNHTIWNAYRAFFIARPGARLDEIRDRLHAALHSYRADEIKTWPKERQKAERDFYVSARLFLEPAAAGRSNTQHGYQRALAIFALLIALVLLIACANVANLMTVQAAARSREMALRVSIGAGRARLIQLVLIESILIGIAASALGLLLSWWAAPFVISSLSAPGWPVRLALSTDWRVTLFVIAIPFAVSTLFGLAPALRASSIRPASALKGDDQPRGHRRLMNALIAAQVAFCSFVLFVAGLFIATFERMANQPTGFSTDRVLTIESGGRSTSCEPWYQATQELNSTPGVESAALSQWALMSGNARTRLVWANGHAPDGTWSNSTWFLGVSPGWFDTMRLPLIEGRDFRWDDEYPRVAIVNRKFAQRYFGDSSPLGRTIETADFQGKSRVPMRIIGVVGDARYEDMRLPIPAAAYVPFRGLSDYTGLRATFAVRTKTPDPMSLASTLRRAILTAHPEIRVSNIITQADLVRSQMIRERLLASLAVFFGAVALILAAVGLYAVLNYAVVERRRELGIRIALGAPAGDIVWRVLLAAGAMIVIGSGIGLWLGAAAERYVVSLLYDIAPGDPALLAVPLATLLGAAILAAIPPLLRALRIDPAALLRAE